MVFNFIILSAALILLASGFNVVINPDTAGSVASISAVVNISQDASLGNPDWAAWTHIIITHQLHSLQLDADGKSRFIAQPPLDKWVVRFMVQDKVRGQIIVKFQGVPVISGPDQLRFIITNVQIPDNCEPLVPFTLSINSGDVEFLRLTSSSITPIVGCQAPPVIYTDVSDVIQWKENGGPLSLTFAQITVNDTTPSPLPMKVTLSTNNGTVRSAMAVTDGAISVDDDRTLVLHGMQSEVNAVLKTLVYTPDANFGAIDNITIVAEDLDYRGPGREGVAVKILSINVSATPTAPVIKLASGLQFGQAGWQVPGPLSLVIIPKDPLGPYAIHQVYIQSRGGTVEFELPDICSSPSPSPSPLPSPKPSRSPLRSASPSRSASASRSTSPSPVSRSQSPSRSPAQSWSPSPTSPSPSMSQSRSQSPSGSTSASPSPSLSTSPRESPSPSLSASPSPVSPSLSPSSSPSRSISPSNSPSRSASSSPSGSPSRSALASPSRSPRVSASPSCSPVSSSPSPSRSTSRSPSPSRSVRPSMSPSESASNSPVSASPSPSVSTSESPSPSLSPSPSRSPRPSPSISPNMCITRPPEIALGTTTVGTFLYRHTMKGNLLDINRALATMVFKSDVRVNCSEYVMGQVNITAQDVEVQGSPVAALSVPIYLVSDALVGACGQDSVQWADFEPSLALAGEDLTLTLKGYIASTMADDILVVALSYSDLCYLQNFSTSPMAVRRIGGRLQVTLPVTEVGNWTVCYWVVGSEAIPSWQYGTPVAMQRKLMVKNATTVNPSTFLAGFANCGSFIQYMQMVNATLGTCGCRFIDNSSSTGSLQVDTVMLPVNYPAEQLRRTDMPIMVQMGCCMQNTAMVTMYPLNRNQSWGYCSQL